MTFLTHIWVNMLRIALRVWTILQTFDICLEQFSKPFLVWFPVLKCIKFSRIASSRFLAMSFKQEQHIEYCLQLSPILCSAVYFPSYYLELCGHFWSLSQSSEPTVLQNVFCTFASLIKVHGSKESNLQHRFVSISKSTLQGVARKIVRSSDK